MNVSGEREKEWRIEFSHTTNEILCLFVCSSLFSSPTTKMFHVCFTVLSREIQIVGRGIEQQEGGGVAAAGRRTFTDDK